MKSQYALLGAIMTLASTSVHGVTLEELAARLDQLEKKVSKYEAKYGPLENPDSAPAPSSVIAMPAPVTGPTTGMATAADIDAAYMSEVNTGGAGNWTQNTTLGGYGSCT